MGRGTYLILGQSPVLGARAAMPEPEAPDSGARFQGMACETQARTRAVPKVRVMSAETRIVGCRCGRCEAGEEERADPVYN